jgi:glycyl-tRNA synthetase beta chain
LATFLLELGTEELPADFVRLALPQLEDLVCRDLAEARLSHGAVQCSGTPRRLAVLVHDLAGAAPDLQDERKGPPAAQAFKDGEPTDAAIGFARRCGVDPSSLEVRETAKGPFVFASVLERGRTASDSLTTAIPGWISSLQGRRFMRWGSGETRFSRPLRWLIALLDTAVLPVTLEAADPPVMAGNRSRGHRLHGEVTISDAASYGLLLAGVGVQIDRSKRSAAIQQSIAEASTRLQADPDLPDELLDELIDLVESPLLVEGSVAEQYLDLPAEVLSTVMRSHQRYVPLYRRGATADSLALDARASLLPKFLCITNGLPGAAETIRRGNERVLKARLADAAFFLKSDQTMASIDRRDQLDRVTFAEGLGSLRDRVERLEWCTDVVLEQLNLPAACADHARRAAHLCKHDLVSQMVGEFPELQGVMGGKYLLAEGEPREVAQAVQEHYLPRGAGDELPTTASGSVVALAERLELLLSIFAKGLRPTGSSDPYALRRAGNGLLQILWHNGWCLDLKALLERASVHWARLLPHCDVDATVLSAELAEFLRQRISSLLDEEGLDPDLVQAVAGEGISLERLLGDPADARLRADLLAQLRRSGELSGVQAVVTRAARLAEKGDLPPDQLSPDGVVDPALFEKPSEAGMLAVLKGLEPIATGREAERYGRLAEALSRGADALGAFFDGDQSVMVMADDPAVRRNRLSLLGVLRNQAAVLADFSRISG